MHCLTSLRVVFYVFLPNIIIHCYLKKSICGFASALISISPVALESNPGSTPLLVGAKGFHVVLALTVRVRHEPLLAVLVPDAVVISIQVEIIVIPRYCISIQ